MNMILTNVPPDASLVAIYKAMGCQLRPWVFNLRISWKLQISLLIFCFTWCLTH